MWKLTMLNSGKEPDYQVKSTDAYSGEVSLHFWDPNEVNFEFEQTVKNLPADTTWRISVQGQGGSGQSTFALYHCLIFGKGATKSIDVAGSGAEIIVKDSGSSGTEDPLNQRSTIGWKIPMFGAQVVIPEYIVDLVCGSTFSNVNTPNVDVGDAVTLSQRIPTGKSNPFGAADVYTNTAGD